MQTNPRFLKRPPINVGGPLSAMEKKKARAKRWSRVQKYPFIPEEIVLSILEYLPFKSLLRFRCVSKQWSRWICERESRKKLLVVSRKSSTGRHSFGTIGGQRLAAQLEVLDAPQPWDDARCVDIYGSCNGLVLIGIYSDLYVWNPSIQWYSHVSSYNPYRDYDVAVSGLCLDSTRNEYKAVLGWKRRSRGLLGTPEYIDHDIEVCSLKNKSWEYIDFLYDLGSGKSGPSMNDRLHWVVSAEAGFFVPQFIVCFEAKTDEFEEFPMPDVPKGNDGNPILGLGVLDGCLCMVLCEEHDIYEGPVQVLSMKEYGVKESWTILFIIKDIRYSHYVVPCFYTGEENTDIIMEITPGYVASCLYAGEENTNTDIIMEGTSGERDRSIRVYKINDESYASFLKVVDNAPLLKYGEAIVYEETFVIPTLCEEVL